MATENKWLVHNLHERLENKNSNFDISIDIKKYQPLNFDQATKEVCEKLYSINKNIYIGLSGGIDSEYVFRRFHSLKIPFTPVIVYSNCYEEESAIAFKICKEYNIEPLIITVDEINIIKKFKFEIYSKLNSNGIGGVPALLVAEYVKQNDGIYIKAEHLIGEKNNKVCVELNEWDFYNDVLDDGYTYDFFLYTPEIVYSMVKLMNDNTSQVFKCELYDIPFRKKVTVKMSQIGTNYYHWLKKNKKTSPNYTWVMQPSQFIERYF